MKDDKYEGATVWPPLRGYYSKLSDKKCAYTCVADFMSLYPSIMISRNFCFSTQIRDPRYEALGYTESPIHAKFVKATTRSGILPSILRDLLDNRSRAKKMMAEAKQTGDGQKAKLYNGRQLALKQVANSVYGITGASMGVLPMFDIAESVTLTGRTMIRSAVEVAQSPKFGATVIYGDTDSIMFYIPDPTISKERAFCLLEDVCKDVTAKFQKPTELQPEKLYENYILTNKKRYVGYLHEKNGNSRMDLKGMESARRDNCQLLRSVMNDICKALVIDGNIQKALDIISSTNRRLLSGEVPITQLVITKSISKLDYKSE